MQTLRHRTPCAAASLRAGRGLAWLALACACPPALADWKGKGEAGLLIARGNSVATSANAKLDLSYRSDAWRTSVRLAQLYGRNASFTTAQRFESRVQAERTLGERVFWFAAVRYENDAFSGFDYQTSVSTGVGYRIYDSAGTRLTATLGAGYRRLRTETLVRSAEGEVLSRERGRPDSDAVANAALEYEHSLTASTRLANRLRVESGVGNTSVANDLSLQVSMTETLALGVGYGVRYNGKPTAGARSTDQLTTVNLVYDIR